MKHSTATSKQHNTLYKKSICALAISSALFSVNIYAEDTTESKTAGLERIEVTARKTTESLQEVPIAVTSVGAAELAENGISNITEIERFSPNTTLQTSRGTNSTLTAFIRGIGQQDPLWGYEPGVGIYIDDVYMARPQGAALDLLDVERIEVLRGPQGTLYGKNTTGGAIKYVTKPMSGDTEFNIEATVGSYSQRDLKITGQIPLIDDKLYLGFGHGMLKRDGFGEFLVAPNGSDTENYNKDLTASRLTLEYHASDNLFMRLAWDKTDDDSNSKGGYRLLPSLLAPDAPIPDSKYDSYTSLPTWNKVELEGISLTIDWQATDNLSLKYVGSKRESYSPTNIDFDNTGLQIFDVPAVYDDENSSNELQASYRGDGFNIVGGLYQYSGESCGKYDAIIFLSLTAEKSGCNESDSVAAYVQSNIDLTEKLSLTLGARYTKEERKADVYSDLYASIEYPYDNWISGYDRDTALPQTQVLGIDTNGDGILDSMKSEEWSRFTPRVGIEYQANENTLYFASYSQGFKSGTFNPRATANENAADPEIVDSFEIGMKKDWTDALRTNITLFSTEHKDRQYIVVVPQDDDTDLGQFLANAASSDVKGIEAEVTWLATENLSFNLAYGHLSADIEQDENISVPLVGLSNTPDDTFSLSANYLLESSVGVFMFNAGYYYRSDYTIFEDDDSLKQDGFGQVNASIAWESNDGNWYGGLHAKNITDKEYMVGGYNFTSRNPDGSYGPGFGGDTTLIGYYGDPRTIHLTLGYRF